ncbi:MAG: Hsp70 family protein, partial [Isosphaeraceae bacterium]
LDVGCGEQPFRALFGRQNTTYIGLEIPTPAVPGVAPPIKALCVVPLGMEEGTEAEVPTPDLGLYTGEEAEFRFLASTVRRDDIPGTVIDRWAEDELVELPTLRTMLEAESPDQTGMAVPVRIVARVTELGTIELVCQGRAGAQSWNLEYNVRNIESGK